MRRGVWFAILVLLFASVQAVRAVPEVPAPMAPEPAGEFGLIEYDIDLHDSEERPYPLLPPDTADLLVRLPAQDALGERLEVQAADMVFQVDGEAEPFAVTGPRVRIALPVFRDPELRLRYELSFAYRQDQDRPHAGLVNSPFVLEVGTPHEGETPANRISLYTNENLPTTAEKVTMALLVVVGLLGAWFAAGRVLFRGLLFGKELEISTALTFSTVVAVVLWLVLGTLATWAWFNPGVNDPQVPYFGYVLAFGVFGLLTLLVGLAGKALDAR